MKFHRITIRDYKSIRSCTIEPRESGITIVEGDNEVGKSSIAEALWLVFEQHDDSSSQLVRSFRPAGRDAATEIEVDVSTGAYRFTYLKRFHKNPRTELKVTRPSREFLAGREAHNRVLKILEETIDRDLWQALRVQQGSSLEPLAAGKHQSLLGALEVAAGQVMGGEREQSLFERITLEYERFYTSTGRERASGGGPTFASLRAARDAASLEAARFADRIDALEERALRVTSLDAELAQLAMGKAELSAKVSTLSAAHEARQAQGTAVESLAAEVRLSESLLREALSAHDARQAAIAALVPRRQDAEAEQLRLASPAAPLKEAQAAEVLAREEATAAEVALVAATEAGRSAEHRLEVASAHLMAEQMAERLARLEATSPELTEVTAWLNECAIDQRSLAAIDAAENQLAKAEGRREAEGASVEVSALEPVEVEIDGQRARLDPDRPLRGAFLGQTKLSLPGGITVTVRAGTHARNLEAELATCRDTLAGLLKSAGVESTGDARELLHLRIAKDERRRALIEQSKNDLRDLPTTDALREKLERERARIARLIEERGLAAAAPESVEAVKAIREATRSEEARAAEAARAANASLAGAVDALRTLERERDQRTQRLAALDEEIARLEHELAASREQSPDAALASALREAEAKCSVSAERLVAARAQLDATQDVSADLRGATESVRIVIADADRLSLEREKIRGVLEDAGAEGLHGLLVEAQQRQAAAEDELESFTRRANAARTLFETMKRHRDRARENYATPLKTAIDALGRDVFGPTFSVDLSDDLGVVRRTLDGITLDISQLSTGVREQLSVLTRIACASLVSSSGGAPLVLDDIFGWADPSRLTKLGPILARAAGDCQVLLFTCTPGRFATVAPARVVTLPGGETHERPAPGQDLSLSAPKKPVPAPSRRPAPVGIPQAAFDLFSDPEPAAAHPN